MLFNTFQTYCQKNSSVKCSKNILIKEWCAYQGNFMERPECVEPLPLEYCEALETESNKYILYKSNKYILFLAKLKN